MTEVHKVTVEIKPPKPGFPGQVALGYYTLTDGVVTMTDASGNPAEDGAGKQYRHKLAPHEDARAIACRMTKELRNALRRGAPPAGFGSGTSLNNFGSPIQYPKTKYV
jgi:hypothetical protein